LFFIISKLLSIKKIAFDEEKCMPKIVCERGTTMAFPFSTYILSLYAQDSTHQWGKKVLYEKLFTAA
jgi:hypothetical protein